MTPYAPTTLLPRLIQAARHGPHAVLAALEAPLTALGFAARPTRAEPRAVLWTRGEAGARGRLVLSGHVDVVPVGEGWTRAPFGGEVAEGRVWGRGACDMLGSVACFVGAAARAPDAACGILLTTDEETRMRAAEVALEEGLLADASGVVVGEPTRFAVGIAEKGVLWARVSAHGKNAHGSMPHLGENAVEKLVATLAHLQRETLVGEHALLGAATKNVGTIRGGDAVNQVPALAHADIDFRYLPRTRAEDLTRLIGDCAARAGARVDVEVLSNHAPFEVAQDAPLVRAALVAVDDGARPVGLPYGTEASKFAPAGLPCVIVGPGEQELAHTNRESITIDDLARGVDVYARMLRSDGDA